MENRMEGEHRDETTPEVNPNLDVAFVGEQLVGRTRGADARESGFVEGTVVAHSTPRTMRSESVGARSQTSAGACSAESYDMYQRLMEHLAIRDKKMEENIENSKKHSEDLLERLMDKMEENFNQINENFNQINEKISQLRIGLNENINKKHSELTEKITGINAENKENHKNSQEITIFENVSLTNETVNSSEINLNDNVHIPEDERHTCPVEISLTDKEIIIISETDSKNNAQRKAIETGLPNLEMLLIEGEESNTPINHNQPKKNCDVFEGLNIDFVNDPESSEIIKNKNNKNLSNETPEEPEGMKRNKNRIGHKNKTYRKRKDARKKNEQKEQPKNKIKILMKYVNNRQNCNSDENSSYPDKIKRYLIRLSIRKKIL